MNKSTRELYPRLLGYVKPYWPILMMGIIANVLFSGVDAAFTYMIKPIMNQTLIDRNMTFIKWLPVMIFVGVIFRGVVNALGGYCMTSVARSVIKVLRQNMFAHMLELPVSVYDKTTSGQLLSKMLYDVEQVANVSADALTTFVQSLCLVLGLFTVMFIINWQLTSLFLLIVPFVSFVVYFTNKKTRKVSHLVQKAMGQVTEIASQAIEGYQVVRVFGGQQAERSRFNEATQDALDRDLKVARIKVYNITGVQLFIAFGISGIISTGVYLSSYLNVSAGGFVSIIAAMLQLVKPMKNLSTVNSVIQQGMAGAESVFQMLDTPKERVDGVDDICRVNGEIEFKDITFAYESEPALFTQFSLTIKAGETVALVGKSGSGKTTLVNLLAGFYSLNDGDIYIDGHAISTLSLNCLRRQLAYVSQHVTLFNDSIAANIAYGQPTIDMARVKQAAIKSQALEFIEKLPDGFNTLVGENGLLLSGGQRQRLAIARAFYKDAPVLILDEATSALDNTSERLIQKALNEAKQGRTVLVIAHRLSTIEQADKIVVMDSGEIIEMGTHSTLLAKGHLYAKLHQAAASE